MSAQATKAEKAPTLEQLDRAITRAAADVAKAKPENKLYVEARTAKNKTAMDKHRAGRQGHERAEARRRDLRKQRASLYPEAPKL